MFTNDALKPGLTCLVNQAYSWFALCKAIEQVRKAYKAFNEINVKKKSGTLLNIVSHIEVSF